MAPARVCLTLRPQEAEMGQAAVRVAGRVKAAPEAKAEAALTTARKELMRALEAVKVAKEAVKAAEHATVKVLVDLAMATELVSLLKPKSRGKAPSVKRGKRKNSFMSGMDER